MLTIQNKKHYLCLQFVLHIKAKAPFLQKHGFWSAICCILARKTHRFGTQNACFRIVI